MRERWTACFLAGFALSLGGCNRATTSGGNGVAFNNASRTAGAGAATTPVAAGKAGLRGIHVVPGVGLFGLLVNRDVVVDGVTYGNASEFFPTASGKLRIAAISGQGQAVAGPLPVTLDGGEAMTVVISGGPGDITLLPFKHKKSALNSKAARLTFIHAAKALPPLDLRIDDALAGTGVSYGAANDYRDLKPGRHTLEVVEGQSPAPTSTPVPTSTSRPGTPVLIPDGDGKPMRMDVVRRPFETLARQLNLVGGKSYSVIVFQDAKRRPQLRVLEDKCQSGDGCPSYPPAAQSGD